MNFIKNIFSSAYEELWKAVIRPNRDIYQDKDLGPEKFELKHKWYKRTDFTIINKRNYKLACSFWEPFDEEREHPRLPCVIYLHGNSSSRCEVIPEVRYLLPRNITVFAFDFTGCGRSEGDYISLGWHEQEDVECVINYLRKSNKVSTIGLWGRSMGAVTALMYGSKDPSIAGLVLDSPFSSLKILIDELARERVNLPNFIINQAIKLIKEIIKEKANFNLDDIEPINYAGKCFIPAYFCHAKGDTFVDIHHCKDLYKLYAGDKKVVYVKGNHNTERPIHFKDIVVLFFYETLRCKNLKKSRPNKSFLNIGNSNNILLENITNINKNNKKISKEKKNNSVKEIRINLRGKCEKANYINKNKNKNKIVKNNKKKLVKSNEDVIINLDDNISIKNIVECPKMKTNSNFIKYINDVNNNIKDTERLYGKSFDYSIPNKTSSIHEVNNKLYSKKDIVNKTQNEKDEEIIQKILQLSKKEFEDTSTNTPNLMINNNIHSKLFKKSTLSLQKNSIYNIPKFCSNKNNMSLVKKKKPNVNISIPVKSNPVILLSKSNYENDKTINQNQNLNLSTKIINSKKIKDKNISKNISKTNMNKNFNNIVFRDIKSNKIQNGSSKIPMAKSFINNSLQSTTMEISFPSVMIQIRKSTKNENKKENKINNPKTYDNISIHHIYNLKNKSNFILKDISNEEHKNMMINKDKELLEKVIASPLNNQNQGNLSKMKKFKYTNITDDINLNNSIFDKNLKKSEISLENESETINNSNFYNKINESFSYLDDDDNFFIEEDNIGINIPHS